VETIEDKVWDFRTAYSSKRATIKDGKRRTGGKTEEVRLTAPRNSSSLRAGFWGMEEAT